MNRLLLTTVLAVLLPSCMIMPHFETLTGAMHGQVVNAKKEAVSGVKVEYFYGSTKLLGSKITAEDGCFKLEPYRQWFCLVYLGSPGVCPFPLSLKCVGQPDALRLSKGDASAIYLIGTPESFRQQWPNLITDDDVRSLRLMRWTGLDETPIVVLTPEMKAPNSPSRIALQLIHPTQP